MERSQRDLSVQQLFGAELDEKHLPVEEGCGAKIVSLDSRRRAAQANDDVEYLVATLSPDDLAPAARPADALPTVSALDQVVSNILVQLLGDAQRERDAAREALGQVSAQAKKLAALARRWEQHAVKTEAWALRNQALHGQVVDTLTERYTENEARLDKAIAARDEAIEELEQLVARTECNLIDALVARDAALALARELLADRWMRRWKREAYEARIDALV